MASITRSTLIAANKALEAKVTALEARLALATTTYRAQRAKIAELEALLNTRGVIATPAAPAAKTWQWTGRDGITRQSTRTGNQVRTHIVQ